MTPAESLRLTREVDALQRQVRNQPIRQSTAGGGGSSSNKSADNKTALDALLEEGEAGYTTGTIKRRYTKLDGVTLCISHTELADA